MPGVKLTDAQRELLEAVERGEIVKMPGGPVWNVSAGRFMEQGDFAALGGLVATVWAGSPEVDRDCILTAEGRAALEDHR